MSIFILCPILVKSLEHEIFNKPKYIVEVKKFPILKRLLGKLKYLCIRREKIIICGRYLNKKLTKEYEQLHNDLYSSTNMIYKQLKALNNFNQYLLSKEDIPILINNRYINLG